MIVQPEVMSELVNHRVANLAMCVSFRCGNAKNRSAKDGDLIGERRVVSINAEELVIVFYEIEVVVVRFFFDDDDDIFEQRRKTFGQLIECLLDELPEFGRRDYQPGRMLNPYTIFSPGRWNGFAA